jgi:hypothetical protein
LMRATLNAASSLNSSIRNLLRTRNGYRSCVRTLRKLSRKSAGRNQHFIFSIPPRRNLSRSRRPTPQITRSGLPVVELKSQLRGLTTSSPYTVSGASRRASPSHGELSVQRGWS